MLVLIRWQSRNVAVPLSQPAPSTRTSEPRKPSATDIAGYRKAISSEQTGVTHPYRKDRVCPTTLYRGTVNSTSVNPPASMRWRNEE
jgi:hypothetical protein